MANTATDHQTSSRKKVRIFVNDQPYFAPTDTMTGNEILALAGLPAGNQVFLEVPGPGDDIPIPADEGFELRPGMKLYDVPVGTFG